MFPQRWMVLAIMLAAAASPLAARGAPELRGSHDSMVRQNAAALESRYEFVRDAPQIHDLVARNQIVEIRPSAEIAFKGVSYPYARPVVREFVDRLAHDYHEVCAAPLVVTSLIRPLSRQPRNASPLSVHPAGMAVDMHIPPLPACRIWLEKDLLALEARGVIDVTREQHPPHFHVAVYPEPYRAYLAALSESAARGRLADVQTVRGASGRGRGARVPAILGGPGALIIATMAAAGALMLVGPIRRRWRR